MAGPLISAKPSKGRVSTPTVKVPTASKPAPRSGGSIQPLASKPKAKPKAAPRKPKRAKPIRRMRVY